MTVNVSKPSINLREKISELDKPSGIAGEHILRSETPQEVFEYIGARNRNLIINGDMSIAQRGTSATSVSSSGYHSLDRFRFGFNETDELVATISQDTDVPSGQGFANSMKFEVTTPETTLASDEILQINHRIEGQNTQNLKYGTSSAESLTLSFWVKSSITGTYVITFKNNDPSAGTRLNVNTYTINSANTWEKKTITITGDTTANTNFVNTNAKGLELLWSLASGGSYQGTSSSGWTSYGASKLFNGQSANVITTNGATWYITGVQLEVGKFATPFEYVSYDVNYQRCQRYYQKTKTASGIGYGTGVGVNIIYKFPTLMRASPSVSLDGVLDVSDYVLTNYTQSGANAAINSTNVTNEGISISCASFSGLTNYRPYALRQGFTNAINLDAEL